MITTGEIGALYCGSRQVGGFLDWEARVDVSNLAHPKTLIAARGLWAFEDIQADNLSVKLYKREGDRLVIMCPPCSVQVIKMPREIPNDTLVLKPVELVSERQPLQ